MPRRTLAEPPSAGYQRAGTHCARSERLVLRFGRQVSNGHVTADVHFVVPYVEWGLKDPSTFILRVSKKVDITVHAVGTLSPAPK